MPTSYFGLAQRNLNREFVSAIYELLPPVYKRADEVAKAEHDSNIPYHRGTARYGKADDALYKAGRRAGFPVRRVPAANGMTHTEVYTPEIVIVTKKVREPGDNGDSVFRNKLCKRNGVLTLFGDAEEMNQIEEEERVFMELTHGPFPDDPSAFWFAVLVVPDEEGKTIDHFHLSSLYAASDSDEGVENPEDAVWPTPRVSAQTGSEG